MKEKKRISIRVQMALGFGVFILIIGVLLWVFQIALLTPFYRVIKTTETKGAAESVIRALDAPSGEFEEQVKQLCYNTGINIVVSDEVGTVSIACFASGKTTPLRSAMEFGGGFSGSRMFLAALFDEVNLDGGEWMQSYPSRSSGKGGSPNGIIFYARVARTGSGKNRMVLLESEITPVDSVQDTLIIQLACVSFIMLILGGGLTYLLSRRMARPISDITTQAIALSGGDYSIRFNEAGTRETAELARTLNYAANGLSQVERTRRDLLANVSHDLRTPLTMIQGYSEVMRDIPGENTPENVQIIIDETQRLTALVNDLLDLSRFEAGASKPKMTTFDLTRSVRDILRRYDKLADYSFPFTADGDVYVTADELWISQVLYNLVNNAINYSGGSRVIAVKQEIIGGRVRISVTDQGEGIPADKLRDIWERYYKVDKEHRRAQVGTGLGLAIVKSILELHGGAYGVESQLGVGSTFWFELDISQSPPCENSEDGVQ